MISKRNFYLNIRDIVNSAIEDLTDFDEKEKEIENRIKSKRYTAQIIKKELEPKLSDIRKNRETRREDAISEVRTKTNEYIAELRKADQLNPSNITDDIKLLQTGIALSADDLAMLFDRNAGNSTMQKLITDYAKQHGRDIQRYYRPAHADLIANIESIPEIMKVVIKWHNKPDVYNQFVGEGSTLDSFLRD